MKNSHLDGGPFFLEAGPIGVLLIHGFTATTAEVRPLANALFANGYTVAGPVLPGHNTYPEEINKYTWHDWVATIKDAYISLSSRCEQVYVGGESTGGLLSLQIASEEPEISGLLMYAPALKLMISPINEIKLRLLAPFIPYIKKNNEDDGLPWKGYTVNPLKGVVQLLELIKHVQPRIQNIHQPILIIQGILDKTVDASVPQMIQDRARSVIKEIHWMEKSSHCVLLDCELEQVVDITLQFLMKVNKENNQSIS